MSLGSSFAVDFVTLLARQCPKTTQAWNDDPMIQGNGFQIIWDSLSKTNHWYHGELEHVGRHIVTPRAPSLRFATPSRRFRARRRSRERLRCVHGKGLVLKGNTFEKKHAWDNHSKLQSHRLAYFSTISVSNSFEWSGYQILTPTHLLDIRCTTKWDLIWHGWASCGLRLSHSELQHKTI